MVRSYRKIIFFIGCIVVSIFLQQHYKQAYKFTRMVFLDVGQGDAIYLRTQTQQDIIIDGGPDDTIVRRLGEVMPPWDRTIELAILSHPDADHLTGIVELFDYYTIEKILIVERPLQSAVHEALFTAINAQSTEVLYLYGGDTIQLNDQEYFKILYPLVSTDTKTLPANDTSYVMEYYFNNTSIIFTGDIGSNVEKELVRNCLLHDIDILKVPHHGSKSSSKANFIAAVQPEYCVIQLAKDNTYGHPHAEVIQRLQQHCTILRNDELGNISLHITEEGFTWLH